MKKKKMKFFPFNQNLFQYIIYTKIITYFFIVINYILKELDNIAN